MLPSSTRKPLRLSAFSLPTPNSEEALYGRRFVELLVRQILAKEVGDLCSAIDKTANRGVASWIRSYMHTVRTLGNEGAHAKDISKRVPKQPSSGDAVHVLFCLERLVRFARELEVYPND